MNQWQGFGPSLSDTLAAMGAEDPSTTVLRNGEARKVIVTTATNQATLILDTPEGAAGKFAAELGL